MNKFKKICKRKVKLFGLFAINFLLAGSFAYGHAILEDGTILGFDLIFNESNEVVGVKDTRLNEDGIFIVDSKISSTEIHQGIQTEDDLLKGIHITKKGILRFIQDEHWDYIPYYIAIEEVGEGSGTIINEGVIEISRNPKEMSWAHLYANYQGINGKIKMKALNIKDINDSMMFHRNRGKYHKGLKHILSGNTEIIAINENGDEQFIDGNIEEVNRLVKSTEVVFGRNEEEEIHLPIIAIDPLYHILKNDDAFTGKVRTTGASEIQLYLEKEEQKSRVSEFIDQFIGYYWTSKTISEDYDIEEEEIIHLEDRNKFKQKKRVYKNQKPIFSQTVPGYVLMPKANMDLSLDSLSAVDKSSDNLWVKVLKTENTANGKERLNMKVKNEGIQVGTKFTVNSNKLGAYFTYQQGKLNFMDKYRAENGYVVADKNTGTGEVKALSLGLTGTREIHNGINLDLIGQLTLLNNKYHSRDEFVVENKGVNIALSSEIRKTFVIKENKAKNSKIVIEPQAQLIYQRLKMKDFNDGYRQVSQGNNDLRLRLGSQITYENKKQKYYAKVNLWQNLINSAIAKIGKDTVKEKYAKNNIELGLGMKMPIFEKANIYGDVLYNKSIGSEKNDAIKATIGINYQF
ncbi:autotransporter outer membrane beta-barrel domain-containing protein [Histophilus somni]|uniref:autotransporter outer membrane beta-barrel domain-containing protein n=1 Tax=Histophilus somni TaxID=731 RepID=UPI00201F1B8F|nr:autotransporter outer membrane beta-barrel domain-containing protein [Histophilus somni]